MSTCDRVRVELGGYVLDGLSGQETLEVEAHLRTCAACSAELDDLSGLPGLLALTREPAARPPERLRESVLASAAASRSRSPVMFAAAAALLVGALLGGAMMIERVAPPAGRVVDLEAGEGFSASGRMTVATVDQRVRVSLDVQHLKQLPPEGVYEAWLAQPGRDEPVSIGQFGADAAGSASVTLWAEGTLADYKSLWVTAEPNATDPSHDGPTVVRAPLH